MTGRSLSHNIHSTPPLSMTGHSLSHYIHSTPLHLGLVAPLAITYIQQYGVQAINISW